MILEKRAKLTGTKREQKKTRSSVSCIIFEYLSYSAMYRLNDFSYFSYVVVFVDWFLWWQQILNQYKRYEIWTERKKEACGFLGLISSQIVLFIRLYVLPTTNFLYIVLMIVMFVVSCFRICKIWRVVVLKWTNYINNLKYVVKSLKTVNHFLSVKFCYSFYSDLCRTT